MEGLINESDSEETVPVPKSIFKRQTGTSVPNFDVSLNESNSKNALCNKSDTSLSVSAPKKNSIFEKAKKPSQHNFSVNFDESNANNETENSVTLSEPKVPFKRKIVSNTNSTAVNQFNVTFNETNVDAGDTSTIAENRENIDESNGSVSVVSKSNPFKKPRQPPKDLFNIEFDETNTDDNSAISTNLTKVMFKKTKRPSEQFQVSFNETNNEVISEPTDKTENKLSQEDSVKENIFVKPANKNLKDAFNVEFEESNFSDNSEATSTLPSSKSLFKVPTHPAQDFEVSFSPTIAQIESQEQESRNESAVDANSETNVTTESCQNTEENFHEADDESFTANTKDSPRKEEERSASFLEESHKEDRSFGNKNSTSEMCLEQSSINDENLNNWMSDNSDEETQIPEIPVVSRKTSFTEEAPQPVKPPSPKQTTAMTWEEKFNAIVSNSKNKRNQLQESNYFNLVKPSNSQAIANQKPQKKQRDEATTKSKPPKLLKPAPFVTKRLYQYIIRKLEPKFGIDTILQSEQIVASICDTIKKVERRKTHQKKLIQDLKKEMASVGLIETTVDFYEFVIKFLPDSFRVKVIPCVQPVTNTVYPPKDTANPFDKIF